MHTTHSVRLPRDAEGSGLPALPPAPLLVRGATFAWGSRTYVMGIVNVTPDSFSGDGLLRHAISSGGGQPADPVESAAVLARAMRDDGADIVDVGGESSRPGHADVPMEEELRRILPAIRGIRAALPRVPISIDTTKVEVASAALEAGADIVNDVWGVGTSDALARLAAERSVPYILMHNRAESRYRSVVAEVIADLQRAVDRAVAVGCAWESILIDPGIGFGKTAVQNLELLRELAALRIIGRPVLLGASRKSTIGQVLDLPAGERLEGTLALTALGVASGVDIVRVHDVAANVRAARMADAVVRGGWHEAAVR